MLEPAPRPKRALIFRQLKPEKGIPYSRQYLSQLEKLGKFPRRFKLGPGTWGQVAWLEEEIDAFLDACAAERDRGAGK
jgi:prophage regulatory protein